MLAAALAEVGELCVCDLAWVAERSQNLVSHHVRALRSAGLVRSRRDGKMVMYALTDAGEELLRSVLSDEVEVRA
jgi:DNA-binding transcriptional ArsR family regulator